MTFHPIMDRLQLAGLPLAAILNAALGAGSSR